MMGPGKIEKAGHQRVHAVDFTRNVIGKLRRDGIGGPDFLDQGFRRPLDDRERISQLVRKARGKLPESGKPLRAPRLFLRLFEAPVGFGQNFRLCAILRNEAVDEDGSEKEKENADGEFGRAVGVSSYSFNSHTTKEQ